MLQRTTSTYQWVDNADVAIGTGNTPGVAWNQADATPFAGVNLSQTTLIVSTTTIVRLRIITDGGGTINLDDGATYGLIQEVG